MTRSRKQRGERDTSYPPSPKALPVAVVDNHTHLDHAAGDQEQQIGHPPPAAECGVDRPEPRPGVPRLLERAASVGVDRAVQIGCELESARWTIVAIERHDQLLGGVAIHPNEAPFHAAGRDRRGRLLPDLTEALTEIEQLAGHPRVRVIGETGLDYYRTDRHDASALRAQHDAFRAHIEMAKRTGLALQIHDRDAHADVLRILTEEGAPERTVFHCFSGDVDMARECVAAGYFLSFSGTLTFASSETLREACAAAPLDRILVETDAPFLTPAPYRGRTNASYLVPLTMRRIAEVKSIDLEKACHAVSATSERIYGPW